MRFWPRPCGNGIAGESMPSRYPHRWIFPFVFLAAAAAQPDQTSTADDGNSQGMADAMPFASEEEMFKQSDAIWAKAKREDILQAFRTAPSHYPCTSIERALTTTTLANVPPTPTPTFPAFLLLLLLVPASRIKSRARGSDEICVPVSDRHALTPSWSCRCRSCSSQDRRQQGGSRAWRGTPTSPPNHPHKFRNPTHCPPLLCHE